MQIASHTHSGRSRMTSAGALSSRSPRKRGCRSRASLVHSANPIWATRSAASSAPCGGSTAVDKRRLVRLQLAQPDAEVMECRLGVAGADLAGVTEGALLVVTDEQGTKVRPAPARIGVTADDELLLPDALQVQPVLGAASDVRCVGALAMSPSQPDRQASANRRSESSLQASVWCNAELDRIVLVIRARRSTSGRSVEILPVDLQKVEDAVDDWVLGHLFWRRPDHPETLLESGEGRLVTVVGHHLTVEQEVP